MTQPVSHFPTEALAHLYDQTSSLEGILNEERYINATFLAEGAIKRVYQVTDTHCGRDIALARIKDELLNWEQSLEFIREVQLTSSFEHPHIIRVYDIGIDQQAPWFTMELTSGKTLADLLKEQPLSLNQKLGIISDICDAIQYAHERDTLHLDLKPENVSIGKQGQVLLGDWGIASSIAKRSLHQPNGDYTLNTHIKGTPGFMAPEQANPDFVPAAQADIFGIGALFYYILTGDSPIMGDSSHVKLASTRAGRFNSFNREEIPPRLKPIITKALERMPSRRYQSALDIKQDIENFQEGFATEAESTSLATLIKLFIQRNRIAFSLICTSVVLLLLAIIYYTYSIRQRETVLQLEQEKIQKLSSDLSASELALASERAALADSLYNESKALIKKGKIKPATEATERAYALKPESDDIKQQLSILYFAQQRFRQAARVMPKGAPPQLLELAAIAKEHEGEILLGDELVALIKKIPYKTGGVKSLLFIDDQVSTKDKKHVPVMAYMIKTINKLSDFQFQWDPLTSTLDLSGNPKINTLVIKETSVLPSINLIAGLGVRVLILDDTKHHRAKAKEWLPNRRCELVFKPTSAP